MGSGFAVSPTLVVTAAHVVEGGEVIRLVQGTTAVAGTVIGVDPGADVALVRTAAPLSGTSLTFADGPPQVGDQIGAIGFPEGDPLTLNLGTISGLGRKAVIAGVPRHSMVEMDADTNPGSSGGPVIDSSGAVVGLVDAEYPGQPGRRLAVSSATAQPLVTSWRARPEPVTPPGCSHVLGPDGTPLPGDQFPGTTSRQVLSTLIIYFRSINNGDFPTAVAQLARPGGLTSFEEAVTSSHDTDLEVHSVTTVEGTPIVWLSFTSHQDSGRGPSDRPSETCTRWSLDYVFAQKNGLWLIDSTTHHPGVPQDRPCEGS